MNELRHVCHNVSMERLVRENCHCHIVAADDVGASASSLKYQPDLTSHGALGQQTDGWGLFKVVVAEVHDAVSRLYEHHFQALVSLTDDFELGRAELSAQNGCQFVDYSLFLGYRPGNLTRNFISLLEVNSQQLQPVPREVSCLLDVLVAEAADVLETSHHVAGEALECVLFCLDFDQIFSITKELRDNLILLEHLREKLGLHQRLATVAKLRDELLLLLRGHFRLLGNLNELSNLILQVVIQLHQRHCLVRGVECPIPLLRLL